VLNEKNNRSNYSEQEKKRIDAVVTDIDGTLTDEKRLINISAIEKIRWLTEQGIPVILASGNTSCLMHGITRFFGTSGTFIAENGGVYRIGFTNPITVYAKRTVVLEAFELVHSYYEERGIPLTLYSYHERLSDVAFAKTVSTDEVKGILSKFHTKVIVVDTGFAIHLQLDEINKGRTLCIVAEQIGVPLSNILSIGDSVNDIEMISVSGIGACVSNSVPDLKLASTYRASSPYGDGFVEIINHFFQE
jgi:phosphoglycolate phosphatase (TIGR01487 family)